MKKSLGILFSIITLVLIPLLTDSGKEAIFGFIKRYAGLFDYWREVVIFILLVILIFLFIKLRTPKNKLKMQFEQLWDKDKNLFCKTCETPVDRDLDELWCPKCKKEVELFDGERKINLQQAKHRLR